MLVHIFTAVLCCGLFAYAPITLNVIFYAWLALAAQYNRAELERAKPAAVTQTTTSQLKATETTS
jgi:hypothetical protein